MNPPDSTAVESAAATCWAVVAGPITSTWTWTPDGWFWSSCRRSVTGMMDVPGAGVAVARLCRQMGKAFNTLLQ